MVRRHFVYCLTAFTSLILMTCTDTFQVIRPRETGRYLWENEQFQTYYCAYCPESVLDKTDKYNREKIQVCYDKNHNLLDDIEKNNSLFPFCNHEIGIIPNCGVLPTIAGGKWICRDGSSSNRVLVYSTCTLKCNNPKGVHHDKMIRCNESRVWDDNPINLSCAFGTTEKTISDSFSIKTSVSSTVNTTPTTKVSRKCSFLVDIPDGKWKCWPDKDNYTSVNSLCTLFCAVKNENKNVTVVCEQGLNGTFWNPEPSHYSCTDVLPQKKDSGSTLIVYILIGIGISLGLMILIIVIVYIAKCRNRTSKSLSHEASGDGNKFVLASPSGKHEDAVETDEESSLLPSSNSTHSSEILGSPSKPCNGIVSSDSFKSSEPNGHVVDESVSNGNCSADHHISVETEPNGHVTGFWVPNGKCLTNKHLSKGINNQPQREEPLGQSMDLDLGNQKLKVQLCPPSQQKSGNDSNEMRNNSDNLSTDSLGASKLGAVPLDSDFDSKKQHAFQSKDLDSQFLSYMDKNWENNPLPKEFFKDSEQNEVFVNLNTGSHGKKTVGVKSIPGGSKPKIINRNPIELQNVQTGEKFSIEVFVHCPGDSVPQFSWTLETMDNMKKDITESDNIHSDGSRGPSYRQTYRCKCPDYGIMGKYTVTVSNKHGIDSATIIVWDFTCLNKCEMTIDKLFDSRAKYFIDQLCYPMECLQKIPEEKSWKGLAKWLGLGSPFINSTEWHKKGDPANGPAKYLLEQHLRPKECTLGHVFFYFALPSSKNMEVLSCIQNHCADHCSSCEICGTIMKSVNFCF